MCPVLKDHWVPRLISGRFGSNYSTDYHALTWSLSPGVEWNDADSVRRGECR